MSQAHISTILPIKNRVLAADEHTAFLAHYDLNEHDVLRGVKAIGATQVAIFDATYFKAQGQQYAISEKLTMTAWVFPKALPTGDRGALVIGKPTGYYFTIDNTYKLSAYWHGKNPAGYHTSIGTCPANQWSHVAVVWSSTTVKLYINGVLDTTINTTGIGAPSSSLDIGSENGGNRHFKGKIHSLGIWAEEKSLEDINKIMSQGLVGSESGNRAFWKMEEGKGLVLRDSSPFHQDIIPETNKGYSWGEGNSVFTMKPQEGRFGGAIAIEEETTNVISSPLQPNISNYSVYGLGDSTSETKLSLVSEGVFEGLSSIKVERIAPKTILSCTATTSSMSPNIVLAPGEKLSFSAYIKGSNQLLGKNLAMHGYGQKTDGSGTQSLSMGYVGVVANEWTRCVGILENTGAIDWKVTNVYIKVDETDSVANGEHILISALQVEKKPFATSFIDGARPKGLLFYPLSNLQITPQEGTIHLSFKTNMSNFTSLVRIFSLGDLVTGNTTPRILVCQTSSAGTSTYFNTDGKRHDLNFPSFTDGEWHTITISWQSGDRLIAFYDGQKTCDVSYSSTYEAFDTDFYFGETLNSADANSLIDEMRIDNVARTEEEILAWYESNSPFWPRGIYRKSY